MIIPIKVTLVGITSDVIDSHPEKAQSPIKVTLVGIVTDINDIHA